jgi:peroxiredoxin
MPTRIACLIALSFCLCINFAYAGKFNKALNIGDPGPNWTELVGTDDKKHDLAEFKEAKVVVIIFTCNHCPVAQANEDRLIAMQKEYADKGVKIVAIGCNNIDADKLPAMKQRSSEKGYNFAYLHDPSQAVGRAYGASVTPQAFVLNSDRRVAYMGAIDDSPLDVDSIKKAYLREAIEALLVGKTPETAETRAKGCGIDYEQ